MAKYKKYFWIMLIFVVMIVVFINYAANTDTRNSENLDSDSSVDSAVSKVETTEPDVTVEKSVAIITSEVEPIPNASANTISVKSYGAKGDGKSDDAKAFQKAIDFASKNNKTLVIPESNKPYLILSTLELKSNTHISGYGATLFMPSHKQVHNIFSASSKIDIANVSIKGLSLLSENDQEGTGEYEDSLTSYVQGIYLFGIKYLTISDVTMENMYIGIKLDASKNGDKSERISINNLEITNSRTPLFITSTKKFKMTNSILDAAGGATKFLHAAYIRGDTSDIEFNEVEFVNSPGGGIHLYNSNNDMAPPQDIRIIDCYIENTKVGIYIYSGAKNIAISNLVMKNIELPFKINSAVGVDIEKVEIKNNPDVNKPIGLFNMDKISASSFREITYDGLGMTGYLFNIGSDVNDLTISELKVSNLYNVGLLYSTSDSIENLIIENSVIQWTSIKGPLLRFRNDGSSAILRDNQFINNGKEASLEAFKTTNPYVILERNSYNGF
jgi:hypothetical protein